MPRAAVSEVRRPREAVFLCEKRRGGAVGQVRAVELAVVATPQRILGGRARRPSKIVRPVELDENHEHLVRAGFPEQLGFVAEAQRAVAG